MEADESYIDYILDIGDRQLAVANRAQMIAVVDFKNLNALATVKTLVGWNDSILGMLGCELFRSVLIR